MKKILAIVMLCALALMALTACGGDTPAATTEMPTTTETPTTIETPTTTEPSTTGEPAAQPGVELLYGTWTVVGGTATTTITEKEITEKDGIPATFSYTVKDKTVDGDGNFSCVVVANNSEFTYTVFKNKSGYGAYGYLEITTNKATLKYAK